MSSFLNIRIKILQNSLKNICDAVFNSVTFQTKGLQLYRKGTPVYALFLRTLTDCYLCSKNQPDKFPGAAVCTYFSKQVLFNPIKDGGAQRPPPPYQFFPCNFYKRRN